MTNALQTREIQITGGRRSATPGRTRACTGGIDSVLLTGKETGGLPGFMDFKGKVGKEPPHVRGWVTETSCVPERRLAFFCESISGSTPIGPNKRTVLPGRKPPAFYAPSSPFRTIIPPQPTGSRSVGLDCCFTELSEPAKTMKTDGKQAAYAESDFYEAAGIAKRLPGDPGFGENPEQTIPVTIQLTGGHRCESLTLTALQSRLFSGKRRLERLPV